MCTERAQERELERKRGGKGRKGEKERDKEKNLGAKKPKLALVSVESTALRCGVDKWAAWSWRDLA